MAFDAFTPDSPMFQRFRFAAALAVLSSCLFALPALAQEWPQAGKTIQLIVPAPGGSGTGDTIARVLAEELQSRLKATFVVDNKAGANGNIGASAAAATAGDGYHFLFSWAGTLAVNKALYKNLSFDAQKDFVPILLVADVPNILVVNNDIPAKDLADFERYAKANPGKLNFGSAGNGSATHMNAEKFRASAGFEAAHIPFKGTPEALSEVMSGRLDFFFAPIVSALQLIREGKVVALAVGTAKRSALLPDIASTVELGYPDSDFNFWVGLFAPAKTPRDVVNRMSQEVAKALESMEVRDRYAGLGAEALPMKPDEFDAYVKSEIETNARIVRAAGIKVQ